MQGKIKLDKSTFTPNEKVLYECGGITASVFKYSTGIEAVKLKNKKGYVTLLPFMGQMIWDIEFLGHNLVMKSIYDEPKGGCQTFNETYGCFLMHCGLTAIGNPTEQDNHLPHGELPIAKYSEAYLLVGEDEKGKYISLSGLYTHNIAYTYNYEFVPECRLYEDASEIEITVNFRNKKDLPLEYFYLCHINHRPVEGSKLLYTAKHENITPHHEVPAGYPCEKETNDYLDKLDKDASIMDIIDKKSQSYAPEIVFTCKYECDEKGEAHTMQIMPDGYSCFVTHNPNQLPFGIRWISRTDDEDALGMVLPSTAEHLGYNYCKEHGQERYLESGKEITYRMKTGILSPEESNVLINKIKKLNGGN